METFIFIVCAVIVVVGSLGVVLARNPVHSALMLVATLFGVAVLFLAQDAQFLAVVQVVVYAGAIVILFLFVLMLLGVDQSEDLHEEPIRWQRPIALTLGASILILGVLFVAVAADDGVTGQPAATAPILDSLTGEPVLLEDGTSTESDATSGVEVASNIRQLGRVVFTDYVFAFELTAVLLTIAVVAAIALNRRPRGELQPLPELADSEDPEEDGD
jgi:NADH-quinone oxidoreductase subunit J